MLNLQTAEVLYQEFQIYNEAEWKLLKQFIAQGGLHARERLKA